MEARARLSRTTGAADLHTFAEALGAVEALAAELLRAERIDGADVEPIFDRAMRHTAEREREPR